MRTPGNWTYYGSQIVTDYDEGESSGFPRAHGYGCNKFFIADLNDGEYHEYQDRQEQDCNGRLLAAAPDLFDAAVHLISNLESLNEVEVGLSMLMLRQAIKKARGE